jgi:hypothetical protein
MEPFSWKKALGSIFNGLDWFKALMIGLKILGIAFIALTIYRAYFMATKNKNEAQILTTTGTVGTVVMKQELERKQQKNFYAGVTVDRATRDSGDYRVGVEMGVLF